MKAMFRLAVAAVLTAGVAWLALPAGARPCCVVCMPSVVTEFAAAVRPGGEFSMEIDDCGRLFRLEAEVLATQVPPACLAAADRAAPGGEVKGVYKEWIQGNVYFEVIKAVDGLRREVMMRPDGTVVGHEDVLAPATVDAGVLAAADKVVPGGEVLAVERISGPEALGGMEYHVKTRLNGEVQRVSVLPGGQVGRVLRKIQAEVKIPRR